jgi:uncharacterized membrane protein YfcA
MSGRAASKWPCALVFAAAGVLGAALGSHIGKAIGGQKLLVPFGILMIAGRVLHRRRGAGWPLRRTHGRLPGFAKASLSQVIAGIVAIVGAYVVVRGIGAVSW